MRRRCTAWTRCATSTPGTTRSMSAPGNGCISSRALESGSGSTRERFMRVTVCELPHERKSFVTAWAALRVHVAAHESELVLLPELAMLEPIWELEHFDAARWNAIETMSDVQLRRRLPE